MDRTRPEDPPLRRAAVVRIYDVQDRMVLLAPDGAGHELHGDSAALARAVLDFLEDPHPAGEVLAHVEALAGAPLPRPGVVDELLGLLLRARAVEVVDPRAPAGPERGPGPRLVLGLTGAAAAMHAPALVQRLQGRGFEVRVVATADALRFVHAEALEALTHRPVVRGMWPEHAAHGVPHIELAEWADAVLVSPASATTVARLAAGDHSSVVSAVALATRAPVLVVPSMNAAMYAAPAVQRNLARLADDGMHVAHPGRGPELAHEPQARTPVLGGAPPPEVVVQLLAAVLRARAAATRPRGPAAWDRFYRSSDLARLPWHSERADPDILAALDQHGAPAPTLEIGAGLGVLAVALAARGGPVVATDISGVALEHARARAPDAPVIWLQDDITATRLRGRFGALVDRACLHLLDDPDDRARYAAAIGRLTAPGGLVILKTLGGADATARGVEDLDAERLRGLLGPALTLEREAASTLAGPDGAAQARLFVLRRKADA